MTSQSVTDAERVLVDHLDAHRLALNLSQRDWAARAGLGLDTVRAWRQGRSHPGSVRLIQAGLAVALRLELGSPPLQAVGDCEAEPPEPEAWWLAHGQIPPRDGRQPLYLLSLAIAELRWTGDLRVRGYKPPMDRFTWHRAKVGFSGRYLPTSSGLVPYRRPPTMRTLLTWALDLGITFVWVPQESAWRRRPWQPSPTVATLPSEMNSSA
ncbi:MAG: hypothetical protein QG597_1199 [Actinomycetota bacterium]|nr:hypothetical protein [Actinomycetota bacterium]